MTAHKLNKDHVNEWKIIQTRSNLVMEKHEIIALINHGSIKNIYEYFRKKTGELYLELGHIRMLVEENAIEMHEVKKDHE